MAPSSKAVKRLFSLAKNECAFPGCSTVLVDLTTGTVIGEICHINARNVGGPRYDSGLTDEDTDSFENLFLMCPIQHKIVDENPEDYTVEKLKKIKMEHEERGEVGPELDDGVVHELLQKEKLRIFQDSKKVLRKSTGLLIGHLRHIQNEGKNYHAIGRIPGEIKNIMGHMSILSSIGNITEKEMIDLLIEEGEKYAELLLLEEFLEFHAELIRWAIKANRIQINF